MSGRFALMVVLALAGSAVIARAGDDGGAGPIGSAAQTKVLRLPTHSACIRAGSIRVSIVPPRGVTLASLTVRAGRKVVLQLAGLSGPGSVSVSLPRGSTRVAVSATDAEGSFLENARTYRRCGSAPASRPAPAASPKPKPRPKPKRRPPSTSEESDSFQVGGGSA